MKKLLVLLMFWWVTTYSGQRVMGPFYDYFECNSWARILSKIYWNVSPYCRSI